MLFNSYIFVFLFFPVSLAGYWLCVKAAEKKGRSFLPSLFLVAASLLFYGYLKPAYLPVLLVSLLVNFAFYRQIEKRKEKPFWRGGYFSICWCLAFLNIWEAPLYHWGSASLPSARSHF